MQVNSRLSRSYLWDILFLSVLTLVFLYFLGLFSYNPLDPSINSALFPLGTVRNLVGSWGASFSAEMIYFLGFGACLIPLPFFLIGIAYFGRKLSIRLSFLFFLSSVLFYMSFIYFFAGFFPTFQVYGYEISTLGKIGFGFKNGFYEKLGRFGAPIVSVLLAVSASLIFRKHEFNLQKIKNLQTLFSRK